MPLAAKSKATKDVTTKETHSVTATHSSSKPDKKEYEAEQARIKAEIESLQGKLSEVRDKISLATKSGAGNDRRNALRAELDGIRDKKMSSKTSRTKIVDQIKALQEGIQKKNKDLQAAKSKIPFKNVAEQDAHIKNLEKKVESGCLKLAEEKRALQEISSVKRSRKILEGFQADYDAIDKDKATLDELRKVLDDPESKAISERHDAIKAELDELKKESDEAYAGRTKLFEERDNIQNELDALFTEKRDSVQHYREANDAYWTKINEDRARKAERQRQQRAAEEAQKKKEQAERLLDEARIPAFQAHIEDCQTLIDYFSGKTTGNVNLESSQPAAPAKPELSGVSKHEIRRVEEVPEGLVLVKKNDEAYFVGKGKTKGKKGPKASGNASGLSSATPSSGALNIPLPTLTALLSLSIPPPASSTDVSRVVGDLQTKKAWYDANQARQTAENIAKAEAQIQKLNLKESSNGNGNVHHEPMSTTLEVVEVNEAAG